MTWGIERREKEILIQKNPPYFVQNGKQIQICHASEKKKKHEKSIHSCKAMNVSDLGGCLLFTADGLIVRCHLKPKAKK
jgi:hypothetical protein